MKKLGLVFASVLLIGLFVGQAECFFLSPDVGYISPWQRAFLPAVLDVTLNVASPSGFVSAGRHIDVLRADFSSKDSDILVEGMTLLVRSYGK